MSKTEDDSWVREFDVSNPQKTHAGYTVYRVSSKVYPKGFPEGASEVIVFKRYSEIRALYKELKIIYENKNSEKKKFPRFAKGHYFDRFDESVIEERQKQALSLLVFAGNISFLFTSEAFVRFFEGGVEHSSRASSCSDTEQTTITEETSSETQPVDETSSETQPVDETGSETQPVDETGSETQPVDETSNEIWTAELYFNGKQDSSDDETIYEVARDLSSNNSSLKTTDEDDKKWLSHAISLCSEGDDIETLASEAGYNPDHSLNCQEDGEIVRASQGSVDMLPTLLESEDEEDVFVEILSPRNTNHSYNEYPGTLDEHISSQKSEHAEDFSKEETVCSIAKPSYSNNITLSQDEKHDIPTKVGSTTSTEEDGVQVRNAEATEDKKSAHKHVSRAVSNIAMSWIDPKKKDYLYQAAQIIQQALYCEANEMYEDAFNKYKICVGILLNGVQHDSDEKRREAVRRKTAQYLVKAEFLFNTYLKHDENDTKDWSVKLQPSTQDTTDGNIVDRQFGHLTLASLNVIGVIGKNMLVQCGGLEGVYIVKALHKTNAVHRSSRQENKQSNKSFWKKYVRSGHMVKLHRHFDTTDTIFLLLQYAAGGCLWNHVKSFRKHFRQTTSNLPDKNPHTSDHTSGVPQPTSGVPQPTSGVPQHTSGVPQPTSGVPQPTSGVPQPTSGVSQPTSGVSQPTSGVPQPTSGVPQPTSGVPQPTSGESSELNCELDWSEERNMDTVMNSSFTDYTSSLKESEPAISTPRQKSCLNEDMAKRSLNDEDNETGEICPTSCGNLLGFLDHVTKDCTAMDKCVQHWIAELLLAVNSVHSCGIILKDLKPCNVLLDENGHVKLSYFGVWEEVDHSVDPEAMQQLYCAPEVSRGEKITFVADWWSLGVLSYELITGKTLYSIHPWGIYPHSSIIFPSQDISAEAQSFLAGLICHNHRERLGSAMDGVEGIKSHAFFQGVDWNELAKSS